MKALVVYDSAYGNTEKIARAIAGALGKPGEVKAVRPVEAAGVDVTGLELLLVGTPVQGGRATKAMQAWVSAIPAGKLKNVKVAAFDTRMKHFVAKLLGYAGDRLAKSLKEKGGSVLAVEGFFVKGREGPLVDGETERAAAWARGLVKSGR